MLMLQTHEPNGRFFCSGCHPCLSSHSYSQHAPDSSSACSQQLLSSRSWLPPANLSVNSQHVPDQHSPYAHCLFMSELSLVTEGCAPGSAACTQSCGQDMTNDISVESAKSLCVAVDFCHP